MRAAEILGFKEALRAPASPQMHPKPPLQMGLAPEAAEGKTIDATTNTVSR
jgi:hypothetical protein